jgi:hypothetical protein
MTVALYFLIPLAALAVVVVLVTGIAGFARGGRFNRQYGNKLMQARVILQFGAIMLLLLLAVLGGTGS